MVDAVAYEPTSHADAFDAVLPGDVRVRVHASRARAYPGLGSSAPNTAGIYRVAARALAKSSSIVDIGSGSGAGARSLVAPGRSVVALDPSAEATAFARAYAPSVRCIEGSLDALDADAQFDGALIVDVLGHVRDPVRLLRDARGHLAPGASMLVGEPRVSDDALIAPVRRAFTPEALEALLVRAGLRPRPAQAAPAEFVVTFAEAALDLRTADALALAEDPRADGTRALDAVARALEQVEEPLEARELLLAYGALHLRHTDLDSAAGTFVGALKMAPNSARGLVGLGSVADGVGRPRDALRLFERATEHDPDGVEGWAALGRVQLKLGDRGAAHRSLARALKLAPDDGALLEAFARVADEHEALEARARQAAYGDAVASA